MESTHNVPQSPSELPASHIRYHHPYFSPEEVEYLSEKQRGKSSVNQEKLRQQACGFIEAVGVKIGFPRKTIATAQSLYHRFHLFFPRKDFNYYEVSLACLYVSTKMHDTLKKPRDILMISYAVRFPELAARSKAIGGEVEMDPATVEQDRQHLLGIERLVLETICFNFTVRMPFPYVIKLGRALRAPKKITKLAWRLAVDSSRTSAPLQYPPHTISLACIYLAALLTSFEQPPQMEGVSDCRTNEELIHLLGRNGEWEQEYKACVEDLEEICHLLLDLLIHAAQNSSTTTSPSTPTSPSPHAYASPRTAHLTSQSQLHPNLVPAPYKHDMLMRLKIHLREHEHPAKPRALKQETGDVTGLGANEGTVRYSFVPERIAKQEDHTTRKSPTRW